MVRLVSAPGRVVSTVKLLISNWSPEKANRELIASPPFNASWAAPANPFASMKALRSSTVASMLPSIAGLVLSSETMRSPTIRLPGWVNSRPLMPSAPLPSPISALETAKVDMVCPI